MYPWRVSVWSGVRIWEGAPWSKIQQGTGGPDSPTVVREDSVSDHPCSKLVMHGVVDVFSNLGDHLRCGYFEPSFGWREIKFVFLGIYASSFGNTNIDSHGLLVDVFDYIAGFFRAFSKELRSVLNNRAYCGGVYLSQDSSCDTGQAGHDLHGVKAETSFGLDV